MSDRSYTKTFHPSKKESHLDPPPPESETYGDRAASERQATFSRDGERTHDPSLVDAARVARSLGVDLERGLTAEEVAGRLALAGPNELRSVPPVPAWRKFVAQFGDPLIYLLLAAIAISLVAWFLEGRVGVPVDAIVIALIVVTNAVLGYVQEVKAENAVAALARMTAVTSAVVRDGHLVRVPSAELVRGDLLVLAEGDAVGADARLVQAASLRVHEASLTG